MTNATSQFKPGTTVAYCETSSWGPRRLSKRTVGKVHKNGRFALEGSDIMYTPMRLDGTQARRSGENYFGRTYLQIWTPAHDAEIAANKRADRVSRKFHSLQSAFQNMRDTWDTVQGNEETFNHIGLCMVAMAFRK